MARVDTLTAYRCKFSYLQRNNPLIEEQREDIKLGKPPEFSFSDFITLYCENASDILIGKNTDKAISLSKESITTRFTDKLSDDRYATLSMAYEEEQKKLKAALPEM